VKGGRGLEKVESPQTPPRRARKSHTRFNKKKGFRGIVNQRKRGTSAVRGIRDNMHFSRARSRGGFGALKKKEGWGGREENGEGETRCTKFQVAANRKQGKSRHASTERDQTAS